MALHRPRTLLLATAVLWAVAYAAWTAGWMLDPMAFALERALRRLPLCVGGALLCLGIGRWLDRARGRPRALRAAFAVLAASILHAAANEVIFYVVQPRWGPAAWIHLPDVMLTDVWVYGAWILLYFALDADAQRRDREIRLAQAEAARVDAQHRLLLQQVNPHFLFNALNTVYALVLDGDGAGAERALIALSSFLRSSLTRDVPALVTLGEELDVVGHYLEIERARFADRLRVEESIPPALRHRRLPPMVLQPLVENCIKHGLSGPATRMTIRMSSHDATTGWVIAVEDDGSTAGHAGTGIGLANLAHRLRLLYGDGARLEAAPCAEGGFVARLHLPIPD